MDQAEFKRFMEAQRKEALKFKEKMEKKLGRELGDDPIFQWIWECSASFRKKWEDNSKKGGSTDG